MTERKPILPYRKDLIEKARKLRKRSTPGERAMWSALRGKKVLGFEFRRQRPVGSFIIDFYCKECMLAIEIDGSSHYYKQEYDKARQKKLESLGITFLRFSESDAKKYTENVVLEIEKWLIKNA
ncbi:MAG: endonuclease domain-containing protein [Balneolaceae bacterium]